MVFVRWQPDTTAHHNATRPPAPTKGKKMQCTVLDLCLLCEVLEEAAVTAASTAKAAWPAGLRCKEFRALCGGCTCPGCQLSCLQAGRQGQGQAAAPRVLLLDAYASQTTTTGWLLMTNTTTTTHE